MGSFSARQLAAAAAVAKRRWNPLVVVLGRNRLGVNLEPPVARRAHFPSRTAPVGVRFVTR